MLTTGMTMDVMSMGKQLFDLTYDAGLQCTSNCSNNCAYYGRHGLAHGIIWAIVVGGSTYIYRPP